MDTVISKYGDKPILEALEPRLLLSTTTYVVISQPDVTV